MVDVCVTETQAAVSATPAAARQTSIVTADQPPWSKLKFSFMIEKIQLELFIGDSNLVNPTATLYTHRKGPKCLSLPI